MMSRLTYLFICISIICFSQEKNDIKGIWLEEEGQSKIEIFSLETEEGTMFGGRIIWLEEPLTEDGERKLDKENPDPELRNKPILGLLIMKQLKYNKYGYWAGGSIYDARSGKTYSLEVNMDKKDILELNEDSTINLLISKIDYQENKLKVFYIFSKSGIYYFYLRRPPKFILLKNGDNYFNINFYIVN